MHITMKTKMLLFLLLASTGVAVAQTPFRTVGNPAFQAGEYLEYRIHYGAVTAGIAKLEVKPEPVVINGRNCFHVVGQGVSSKTFSSFFRVNDKYETYIDQESMMPWRFKRRIEEGNFRDYIEVDFDQNKNLAHQRRNNKPEVRTSEVPAYIQDVVSAFYYARTQSYDNAKPGDIYHFQNFIDNKVYDLDVKFMGREVVTVGTIKYNCVKLKPLVVEGGIYQHKGDLWVWISDDDNKIPIRVESGLVIGSVQIDLKTAENLMHPMTCRVR